MAGERGKGITKVVRQGVRPSVAYGAGALAVPGPRVEQYRQAVVATLPGGHRGASSQIRLSLCSADPGPALRTAPSGHLGAASMGGLEGARP